MVSNKKKRKFSKGLRIFNFSAYFFFTHKNVKASGEQKLFFVFPLFSCYFFLFNHSVPFGRIIYAYKLDSLMFYDCVIILKSMGIKLE